MRVSLALLALFVAVVAAAPRSSERIVGGSVTTISQYPTTANLMFSYNLVNYFHICGGTILNTRSILTAAHCLRADPVIRFRVRVGSTYASSGGFVHSFDFYTIHPDYNVRILDNDIAIMRTSTAIAYVNNAVQPAAIAGTNYNLADNQEVWAAGWGATSFQGVSSEQLRHVQVWVVNQQVCRSNYAEMGLPVTDNMLCIGLLEEGGRGQCHGDSGGPLFHNNVLVGICSWGLECARPLLPSVNTRVTRYTAWIQANA